VAASSREHGALVLCLLLASGCTTGRGEGDVVGQVWAPDCNLIAEPVDLKPNFFAMQPSRAAEIINIVVQRGSDLVSFSDGINVFIRDPALIKESMLGTDIEFQALASPVEMTLYLNARCTGYARTPVAYAAISGTIRFDQLFVPWMENETKETIAVFSNVLFVDNKDPEQRRAVLDGDFQFLFKAGLPAQYFQY